MYELQASREIGPMDQMFKPFFWCFVLCFPVLSKDVSTIRALLQRSLTALTQERPYLTGTIKRIPESLIGRNHIHLEVKSPTPELQVVFQDLNNDVPGWADTYEQLRAEGIPLRKMDSRVIAPLTAGVEETKQVMAVQANFVEGGLLLSMCFHHNFVDGYGASRIIARFSEHCAGLAEKSGIDGMPEVVKYKTAQSLYNFHNLKDDQALWRLNCLDWKEPEPDQAPYVWPEVIPSLFQPSDPPIVSTMFSFSPEALGEIKELAQPDDGSSWVSSNDAFVAFLWRHTMRARFPWSAHGQLGPQGDRESRAVIALDGRKDLSVPASYIGNCVFHCYTELTVGYVGSPTTKLSELASRIRQTVTNTRSAQLLNKVVGLAATIPDVSTIRYTNDNLGTDIYTTSWTGLPLYKLDWGPLGKMDYLRVPDRHFETLFWVLPPRDGVVELISSMREPDTKRLLGDTEFTKFAKPM